MRLEKSGSVISAAAGRINSASGLWLSSPLNPQSLQTSLQLWLGGHESLQDRWLRTPGCCEMAHVLGQGGPSPTTPTECHCRAVLPAS